jgi:hypothetical protein
MIKFHSSAEYNSYYEQNMVLSALSAAKNFAARYTEKLEVGPRGVQASFEDVVADAADCLINEQMADPQQTLWEVMGLIAAENTWNVKAADSVRSALQSKIRLSQYQQDPYWGGACQPNVRTSEVVSMTTKDTRITPLPNPAYPPFFYSTCQLMQMIYYVGMHHGATVTACSCGAPLCASANTDMTLNNNLMNTSCYRITYAANVLQKHISWSPFDELLLNGLPTPVATIQYSLAATVTDTLRLFNLSEDFTLNCLGTVYPWEEALYFLMSRLSYESPPIDSQLMIAWHGLMFKTFKIPGSARIRT